MRLKLDCVFAKADQYGTIKSASVDGPAHVIDGMEVAGFSFHAIQKDGGVQVFVDGDGLSDKITPNAGKVGEAVFQIGFKKEPGRRTAGVINTFLRRAAKALEKSKAGCNVLLVRGAEVVE